MYKVVGSEDYVTQVYQYVSFKEIFGLMPYCLFMIIALGLEVKFDKFDGAAKMTLMHMIGATQALCYRMLLHV